ncbi:hypothetical protein ACJZ2D_017141 [Fusarium nematophilum]
MLGLDLESKRNRTQEDYHYHDTYQTRWSDNDVFGHMNNPYYGVLCDSIVNKYLIQECGYRPSKDAQAGIIVETHFDYFGSVSYPDTLEVGLRVVKLGKTSSSYEIGVFKKGDRRVKAVGGSTHVWVDVKDGQLGRPSKEGMPARVRKGLRALMEDVEPNVSKAKV